MLPTPSLFSWGKLVLYNFKASWLIITIIPTIVQIIKCHFLANMKAKGNAEPKLDKSDWGKNINSMVEREVYSRTRVHVSANGEGTHLPITKEVILTAKPTWRRRKESQPKELWRHEAGVLFYSTLCLLCLCTFFYIRKPIPLLFKPTWIRVSLSYTQNHPDKYHIIMHCIYKL